MDCELYTWHDIDKTQLKAGDFVLTHSDGFFDQLIHLFTMSAWNHVALIYDEQGAIVELVDTGIKKHHISKYKNQEIYLVQVKMDMQDRSQVVHYADVMLARHEKYGFLTIASIAFKIITKFRLVVKLDGTLICSEFVANALFAGGYVWDKDTSLLTPADLYNAFVLNRKAQIGD